jgi:hypothetical protein
MEPSLSTSNRSSGNTKALARRPPPPDSRSWIDRTCGKSPARWRMLPVSTINTPPGHGFPGKSANRSGKSSTGTCSTSRIASNFALSAVTCSTSEPWRALGITSGTVCMENPAHPACGAPARTWPTAAHSAPAAAASACPHAQVRRVGEVTLRRAAACSSPAALAAPNSHQTDAGDLSSPGKSGRDG